MITDERKFLNSLQKAYKTILNFTTIADEDLAAQLPNFEEFETEEECIQIMSLAYQKITEILQNEQNQLLEKEERNYKEIERLRIDKNQLKQKVAKLEEHNTVLDKKVARRLKSGVMISFQHQEEDFVTKEDVQYLESQIEEQKKINQNIVVMELENEIKQDIQKRLYSLEEEIKNLENEKLEMKMELKHLKHSSKEFQEYQNITKEQKRYLKTDFKKLVRKNEDNFEKYQELLVVKNTLDREMQELDNRMDSYRKENKIMNMNTKDIKMLEEGLNEQEKINMLLQEKLDNLERKTRELGIKEPIKKMVEINLVEQGRDFELSDDFKVEIVNQVDYEQEIMKNYDVIEELEEIAEKLSKDLIAEAALQEELISKKSWNGNKENLNRQSQRSQYDYMLRRTEFDEIGLSNPNLSKKLKSLE